MSEVREAALVVRLSPAERASWHAAARAAGWGKTAGWVRSVVAAAAAGRASSSTLTSSSSASPVVDREVLAELARIGSNVNQLARAVNIAARSGQRLEVEAAELEGLRLEVSRLTAAVTSSRTSSTGSQG